MYSRSTVRRFPAGTWWSSSSSVFQPKPAPIVTRPPERWSRVAIALASVIGSDSTGSATAVESRIREVTAAHVARETQGSSVRRYRSSGSSSPPVGCAASRRTGMWVCSGT